MLLEKTKTYPTELELSQEQIFLRDSINKKVENGEYKLLEYPCVCGHNESKLIAIKDRYGININTVICKHCGMIRTNPYYTEDTLNDFYNTEYRKLYVWGERDDDAFYENQKQTGIKYLNNIQQTLNDNFQNKTVYEIGCGMGGILQPFKDNGCKVKGVDLGKEYISIGKNKFGMDLEVGSTDILKMYEKADLVILSHVLEHIIDPINFLNNVRDIMKDNAILYVAVPTIEIVPTCYSNNLFYYLQNAHIYNFSNETLHYTLECSGYTPINTIESEGVVIARNTKIFRDYSNVNVNAYIINMARLININGAFCINN